MRGIILIMIVMSGVGLSYTHAFRYDNSYVSEDVASLKIGFGSCAKRQNNQVSRDEI